MALLMKNIPNNRGILTISSNLYDNNIPFTGNILETFCF